LQRDGGIGIKRSKRSTKRGMNLNVRTDVLSTRQVAQLLGVGEATVKRWADAGEIECFRTPGGHRKFRLRDVTAFVQKRQFEVAGTMPTQLDAEAEEGPGASAAFEKAALAGDASTCVAQLAALRLRGSTLAQLFDAVVSPALVDIGVKWETCKLNVAEEHVASQAVIDAIARAQPLAEPPGEPNRADRGTAVVAAVAGELHDIAVRMVACLLRARGFEVLAPLAQTPAKDLAQLVLRSRASVVALSSTTPRDIAEVEEQVTMSLQASAHTAGKVIVGGPGMGNIPLPEGVILLRSMRELDAHADQFARRRVATRV
jgi:MerR family transcriptional regulator, light-induced transcriptional regulator